MPSVVPSGWVPPSGPLPSPPVVAAAPVAAEQELADPYLSAVRSLEASCQKPHERILTAFVTGIPDHVIDATDIIEQVLTLCGPLTKWKRVQGPNGRYKSKISLYLLPFLYFIDTFRLWLCRI
jgi:hypothetical protein